jgi:hypothetical protein
MSQYQTLIQKISTLAKDPAYSNFTLAELALLKEALETIQFLELFFKGRKLDQNV